MRHVNQVSPKVFLNTTKVFDRVDLETLLKARGSRNPVGLAATHVRNWKAKGLIAVPKKALYVSTVTRPPDPLLLAAKGAPDAVLGYSSALYLFGLSRSLLFEFPFLTTTRARAFRWGTYRFSPTTPPRGLSPKVLKDWTTTKERDGQDLAVTTLERTVVDAFDRLHLVAGTEEAWAALTAITALDLDALHAYARLIDSSSVYARLGYYLSRMQRELMVPEALLQRLESRIPSAPTYFRPQERGNLDKRWNLFVPRVIQPGHFEAFDA
jgi:predicted transcriptional regulator of viral defense system